MTHAPASRFRSFRATAVLLALAPACGSSTADVPPDSSITPPPVTPDGRADIDSAIDPCTNPDGDGDGHAGLACGGDDCDDTSASVFPGATEGALRFAADIPSIPGNEGLDLDARTDATGSTHVAYNWRATGGTQERLRYLRITAAGTVTDNHVAHTDGSSISSHVGRGISLAVDSQNRPHVTFFDQWNTGAVTFFHGVRAAGSWTFASPTADQDTSIAIAADDTVHAATSGLRYLTNAGGTLVASDLASGYQPAIAVAPDGSIHVLFATPEGVRHATKTALGWTIESVEDFVTNVTHPGVQAAFDASGVLHAVYRAGNAGIRYARKDATWSHELVATESASPPRSLRVLPDGTIGTVFIDWLEGQGNTLMLAFRGVNGWRVTDSIACGCADAALVERGDEIGVVFDSGGNLALGAFLIPDGIDNDCDGTAW